MEDPVVFEKFEYQTFNSMIFKYNIGKYSLTPMPGSTADVLISHNAVVYEGQQNQGFGQNLHKQRLEKAKELGYSYVICTVNKDNEKQIHILEKNGWNEIDSFVSKCTSHELIIFGRQL